MSPDVARRQPLSTPKRLIFANFWQMVLRPTEGKIGTALVLAFTIAIIIGPWIAPYGPTELGVGLPYALPSGQHLLGTDQYGRDVLSRLLAGGRSVVVVPVVGTVCAFFVGGLPGMMAGYRGGALDLIVTRLVDVLLALPPLLIVLVIVAAFGSSTSVLIISVVFVYSPRIARVLRGATQGVVSREYVQAAQSRGERPLSIVLREVLPNITAPVVVEFALRLTWVTIFVATLTFLGLGIQPPAPNWALMVSESRTIISIQPYASLAPALAIGILSIGVNLIADAISQSIGGERGREFIR